ncbi:hypothetical protein CRG98_021044 [Punica granatum]|uniref:Uncharacterized protein n=1 Tax=Punica granatum TaxID=22663 RepID=A0A2I0JQQ8_PUNGR|nr:hypothetical protein CRG98_021044 [Punica granatum]
MAEENQLAVFEENTPPTPIHSQPPTMHAPPPLTPVGVPLAHHGAPSTHLLPPASSGTPPAYSGAPLPRVPPLAVQVPSIPDDNARIAALEGTVNQLAANMATNMAELMALLKGPNRASSSSTSPPRYGPTVDPNTWVLPTFVQESGDATALTTAHIPATYPVSNLPVPPAFPQSSDAPAVAPFPPTAISELPMSVPPPVFALAPAPIFTVPPPTTHAPAHTTEHFPSQAPQSHIGFLYQAPPPINTTFPKSGTPIHAIFHGTLKGTYYSHLMGHKSTFSKIIMAGKQVDLGIKLGRLEGPTKGKGEEFSKKTPAAATSSGGRRGKEVSQYSVNFAPVSPSIAAYASLAAHYQPQPPAQPIYYSALSAPLPVASQAVVHHYTPAPPQAQQYKPPASRAPQPTQQVPPPQGQQGGIAQPRPRRQYAPLPVPLSHIYRQLHAGNKIGTIAPGPNFDPTAQDQSKRCEYHQGAPGHTLDNCWRLRERIQEMIDAKELSFNAVRAPNYVPAEVTVGFTGLSASPTPFVIYVSAREPYLDKKVPWAYGGNASSLEHQFSVMGVTRSGRVYENPEGVNKGKVPAAAVGMLPKVMPIPQKKVTEEEAEAFMKIIKASEYKVVEQMAKSPAHISLLALLLSSEPHREALLQRLKFIVEEKLITVKGEEDYAIYKETAVPYISIGCQHLISVHRLRGGQNCHFLIYHLF